MRGPMQICPSCEKAIFAMDPHVEIHEGSWIHVFCNFSCLVKWIIAHRFVAVVPAI